MFVTLSTYLTVYVYSWNWIFYLNYIIWYWIRSGVDDHKLGWDSR
jgi:hypothetical protein